MDRVSAIASNFADWHETSLRALGRATRRTDAMWSCEDGPAIIYLMGISQGSRDDRERQLSETLALAERRDGDPIVVADMWDSLGLDEHGFTPSPYGAINDIFWRPAGSVSGPSNTPDGFIVEEVNDADGLRDYERISIRGFGSEERLSPLGTFGVHAVGILNDTRMRPFVGRLDGEPVSGAMSYVSDDVNGVYGVATPPEYRRQGFAEAVTRAAVDAAPGLPAWLDPSPMAESMYRRLGFESIGQYTAWMRPEAE